MPNDVYRHAIDAADYLLSEVYRLPVSKALDPQNPKDFHIISQRLASALKGLTGPAEAKALKKALGILDVDWAAMTPAAVDRVVEAARASLAAVPTSLPEVVGAYRASGSAVVKGAKQSFKTTFGVKIPVDLSTADDRIIAHSANAQALYVRDEYGRRSVAMSNTARDVVSRGLKQGLGRYDLAADIKEALGAQAAARSDAYWNMAAGVFVNRSRVYGNLAGFSDAGITQFEFDSILDEVTSLQCRFMHGRIFDVQDAQSRYEQVAQSADPEDVKTVMPWVGVQTDDNGNQTLHVNGTRIATVENSGMGRLDDKGSFTNEASASELSKLGVLVPPLHGNCRSTIRPLLRDYSRSVGTKRGP